MALTFSHFEVGRPNFMGGKCSVSCVQICIFRQKENIFCGENPFFKFSFFPPQNPQLKKYFSHRKNNVLTKSAHLKRSHRALSAPQRIFSIFFVQDFLGNRKNAQNPENGERSAPKSKILTTSHTNLKNPNSWGSVFWL